MSNTDITGIGVRVSLYTMTFAVQILNLLQDPRAEYLRDSITTSIGVTGIAFGLTTILQRSMKSLSFLQTIIVCIYLGLVSGTLPVTLGLRRVRRSTAILYTMVTVIAFGTWCVLFTVLAQAPRELIGKQLGSDVMMSTTTQSTPQSPMWFAFGVVSTSSLFIFNTLIAVALVWGHFMEERIRFNRLLQRIKIYWRIVILTFWLGFWILSVMNAEGLVMTAREIDQDLVIRAGGEETQLADEWSFGQILSVSMLIGHIYEGISAFCTVPRRICLTEETLEHTLVTECLDIEGGLGYVHLKDHKLRSVMSSWPASSCALPLE